MEKDISPRKGFKIYQSLPVVFFMMLVSASRLACRKHHLYMKPYDLANRHATLLVAEWKNVLAVWGVELCLNFSFLQRWFLLLAFKNDNTFIFVLSITYEWAVFLCLSVCLSVCLSLSLSIYLSLSVCLSICLSLFSHFTNPNSKQGVGSSFSRVGFP